MYISCNVLFTWSCIPMVKWLDQFLFLNPSCCCSLKRWHPICYWFLTTYHRHVNTKLKVLFPDINIQIYWQYYKETWGCLTYSVHVYNLIKPGTIKHTLCSSYMVLWKHSVFQSTLWSLNEICKMWMLKEYSEGDIEQSQMIYIPSSLRCHVWLLL